MRAPLIALALLLGGPALAQNYPSPTFGAVILNADPTAANQAARKGYVDSLIGNVLGALNARVPSANMGAAGGVAVLDGTGKLPASVVPAGSGGSGSYTLPAATATVLGGVKIGSGLVACPSDATQVCVDQQSPPAASSVPTLANARILMADGTYLTGTQLQALFAGQSGTTYATAFTATLSSASTPVGSPVTLTDTPSSGSWPAGVVLTPAVSGCTASISPASASPSGTAAAAFTVTPSAAGTCSISTAASPAMTSTSGAVTLTATAISTHYLSLGSDGTGSASTPHAANQNAGAGVFDLRVRMQAGGSTWAGPSGIAFLASRWSNGQEYVFGINSSGQLIFISRDEAGNYNQSPTFTLPTPNGSPLFARVANNQGAAAAQGIPAHTGRLYTSTDGATWTQAVEYTLSGTSMFVTTQATAVGAAGGNAFPAGFHVLGMTELVNGAAVLDVDFTAASTGAATVAGATGGAWTVNAPAAIQ